MAPDGRPAAKLPAKYGGDDDVEWNEKFSAGEACAGPEGVDAEMMSRAATAPMRMMKVMR